MIGDVAFFLGGDDPFGIQTPIRLLSFCSFFFKDDVANVCRPCGLHFFFPFRSLLWGGMVLFEMKSRSSLHSTLLDFQLRSDRFMQPCTGFFFFYFFEELSGMIGECVVTRVESLNCHIALIGCCIIIVAVPCLNDML